jgi:hypothetical protein
MPDTQSTIPDAERKTVSFTVEAEIAIQRFMRKLERGIRARSIDDAVRARGLPAEVTGTDVSRAYTELLVSRPGYRRRAYFDDPDLPPQVRGEFYLQEARTAIAKQGSKTEKLAKVYIAIGIVIGVLGVLFPPLYKLGRGLLSDPIWRLGLGISAIGIATAIIGVTFQSFLQSRALRRKRPPIAIEEQDEQERHRETVVSGPSAR